MRFRSFNMSWARSESNRDDAEHAWVTATPGATPVCAPETKKPPEDLLQGWLQVVSVLGRSLRVWSLPFVRRGLRLALDTHDGPLAGEVRPIMASAHVSDDAFAPRYVRGCSRDRHDGYRKDASAATRRSQRSESTQRSSDTITIELDALASSAVALSRDVIASCDHRTK